MYLSEPFLMGGDHRQENPAADSRQRIVPKTLKSESSPPAAIPRKENLEDQELVLKFLNSDTRNFAFNQLVRKYQQKVYWHIRKMVVDHDDADDLTQDVFIKVWKNLENFRQ